MAEIKPIRPLRYTKKINDIKSVVCPPYDIISDQEREALINSSEYNIVRLEKPEGGDDRYAAAAKTLNEWIESGVLSRDEKAGIFVYRERFTVKGKEYFFSGMICLVKLCEFSERVILPHEETLSKAKTDRFNLLKNTHCNFSSVYSLYLDEEKKIEKVLCAAQEKAPEHEFTDADGVTHSLWKIENENDINYIVNEMKEKQLFIADGHHRYETSLNFRRYLKEHKDEDNGCDSEHILMTLVNMDNSGLVVFPTHRLIRGMDVDKEALVKKCGDDFNIKEINGTENIEKTLEENKDVHAFALYTGGDTFTLFLRKEGAHVEGRSQAYCDLDVTVLHTLILEKALGIDRENMANQINLRYTRSFEEAVKSVKDGESSAAFILNPTKVREIKSVALASDKMPQKSTYFYPKLITGLVMNQLD